MVDNCREHIKKIREDFQATQRVKNSLNNSIKTLARDLYAKDTHFILELIQNAEDNIYHEVKPSLSFRLSKTDPTGTYGSEGALIIQNNEIGFASENVEAICAVGETTKSKIQGYIGEKGIGFKSVFKVTSNPHIFSNGYSFCLPEREQETGLGYIVPIWIETPPDSLCRSKTTIILPLDKPDFGYSKIEEMLHDIEPATILFLSKIKKIIIETDIGDNLTILKDDSKKPLVKISVEGNRQGNLFSELYEFLLCKREFNKPKVIKQENREEIETREVSIAFPVKKNQKDIGKIFAYLPVRADTGLPFLINADFILPSSREDIQDVPWNRWLMRCVAELMGEALLLLKKRGLLKVDFLEMLASRLNELAKDKKNMFYPIVEAVRDALMNDELLPADDGTFVSATNAKLASAEWIRKLLRDKQLKLLFESKAPLKWITGEVTESGKHSNLWKYIREILEVEEVTPDSFARKVDLHFFKKQTDKWFIEFYEQLIDKKSLWGEGFYFSNRFNVPTGPLRSKPFIRLQNGGHVEPFRYDGLPNAYRPPKGETAFPIVKRSIAKDEQALSFLKKLPLPEPDNVSEVIDHIIPKYLSSPTPVSHKEHKRDIIKIQQALRAGSPENKPRLMQALQKTPFILSKNSASSKEIYQKPGALYFQDKTLENYFSGNPQKRFVSDFYKEPFLELFEDLGVSRTIRVKVKPINNTSDYVTLDYKGGYRRGLKGFDPDIVVDGLEHAIENPSKEKSRVLWNKIAVKFKRCIRCKIIISSRRDFSPNASLYYEKEMVSDFGKLLIDNRWLPNKNGEFCIPSEMYLNDLPEDYERDEQLADLLGMKKDIINKLAEEAGVNRETIALARDLERHPDILKSVQDQIQKKKGVEFPTREVADSERRKRKVVADLEDSPEKQYEPRTRSVRVSEATEYVRIWLKNQYINKDGKMVCQICKNEMPFKKRDGEYYFEAVGALSRKHLTKEHEAQFLALCPLCAAMYKELLKKNEAAMAEFKNSLVHSDSPEIPVELGDKSTVRFVETHWSDLKTILNPSA